MEGTSIAGPSALAYLSHTSGGALPERVQLLVRSRSGRWVQKYENTRRLTNFRWKTLPPEHPLRGNERVADYYDEWLGEVRRAAESQQSRQP